jgi:MraZ protein
MFEGRFSNTLDDKGRVALPVRYREALSAAGQDRVVLTIWDITGVPCLEGYDARGWQDLVVNLQSKGGAFGQNRALLETVYIGESQSCQPDKQGRILIPPALREHAGLTDEAVFVGVGRKFQIFNPTDRKKLTDRFRGTLHENPGLFNDVD